MMKKLEKLCECGSGLRAEKCCLPLISGVREAQTAEELMRSRFVAYKLDETAYIKSTWHSSTRPEEINSDSTLAWTHLEIIDAPSVPVKSVDAYVEFKAWFIQSGVLGHMHERSRFVLENERWFYIDGEQYETTESLKSIKPGRNDPCFCGSGKKYKKCCGKN